MLQRKILSIIHNQALDPKLDHRPHEFGLAVAPPSSQRQPQCREQLVAQSQFLFIVFRSRDRQDRWGASRSDQVSNAYRLASTRISDDHMPALLLPGGTQHRLEPALKGRLDEDLLAKDGMSHGSGSSRKVRMGKARTGRSGSASGTAGGSVGTAGFLAWTLANRSITSAG